MDLEPLDPADVADQLSKPPFVYIPGVVNVRDLGSYPTDQPGFITKPRMVYRSGEISYITSEGEHKTYIDLGTIPTTHPPMSSGITELRDILGISKVYDLRSDTEMQKYGTPIPEMEGVEVIHVPVFKREDYSPEAMARYALFSALQTRC